MSGFFTDRDRGSLRAPLVLGHRGAPTLARENTIASFRAARDAGADGVELDVRCSADGILTVHHDAKVTTGAVIGSSPFALVRAQDPEVATLAEALDACAGMVVNVEIKNWPTDPDFDSEHLIADRVVGELVGRDRIVVSSFNPLTLERVAHLAPTLETAWLLAALDGERAAAAVTDAAARGFGGVHPECKLATGALIAHARELGLAVRVWTVDDPAEIERLAAEPVDAVITNEPAMARAVLARQ